MKTMKISMTICILFAFVLIRGEQVFSQDDLLPDMEEINDTGLEEEMAWLQAETFVITASRVLESIKKSAASITVITDKQIRQMGARHLMDVLRTVPGMSYRYSHDGGYKIDARGLMRSVSQDVLIMVNSHPLNENFTGGALDAYDTVILDNIQRIEVIRGPGSALYGANAFSAVINIITKDAQAIDGGQVSARGGSYNTQQYNLLFGKAFNDLGVTFNFNYFNTEGFEGDIEQDRQTFIDQIFGTNVSLAPGHTKERDERYDAALMVRYKGLKFEGRYIDRELDVPVGIVDVLTEKSISSIEDYYLTLSYEGNIREGLDFSGKVYRNNHSILGDYQGYPPGVILMTLAPDGTVVPDIFPDGVIAKPSSKNNRTGIEIMTTYKLNDSNTVVAGATYEKMEQYGVEYSANFLYAPVTDVIIPLSAVQDITVPPYNQNYNKDVSRTFTAGFLENIWDIKDDLRLTVGARYDHYSDFGGSFNPRAGLAWEFTKGYDLKLLYGRAFRAPNFSELYSQNNPYVVGNPDLDPETVDTYEISFGAEITDVLKGRVTGFRNEIKDSINQVPVEGTFVFQNAEELRSQGVEVEAQYDFGKGIYVAANSTYQDIENMETDEGSWKVPKYKGNLMANIRLSKYFNVYANVYFQGDYEREEGDEREDNPGFTIVNTTLIAKNFIGGLEIRGSVYNLFDEDYTFPTAAGTLPVDLPRPGRNFMVELQYKF